jgi:hypothetical protein
MKLNNVRSKVEESVVSSVWLPVQNPAWNSVPNSVWHSVSNSVFSYLRRVFQFKYQLSQRVKNEIG